MHIIQLCHVEIVGVKAFESGRFGQKRMRLRIWTLSEAERSFFASFPQVKEPYRVYTQKKNSIRT